MKRTACVAEAGLLDIEFRYLHDSVAYGQGDKAARDNALANAGFHDPHGFRLSCALGEVTYAISTEQGPQSERMCGGSPEVSLTVTRNGAAFISDVIFGDSGHELASVMRVTIGDGPNSSRGRETQVCFSSGKRGDPQRCRWTFERPLAFGTDFPLDQARVQSIWNRSLQMRQSQ